MKPQFWQRGLFLVEATIALATSVMSSSAPDRQQQNVPTDARISQPAPEPARPALEKQQVSKPDKPARFEVNRP